MLSSSCKRVKQLKLYNLQKDVISTQKRFLKRYGPMQSCKKRCGPMQNGLHEKSCEIQVVAKKWL